MRKNYGIGDTLVSWNGPGPNEVCVCAVHVL